MAEDIAQSFFLRDVAGGYMAELGAKNPRVVVVNADLMGTCRNRSFCETYPERSYNVGIAEQNMISFAAGLAHEGYLPYAFSMAPFISMRACEQCRTDVAYANVNVRLMATYAGCSGGISGATHWSIEDCAIMCGIPNMTVIEGSDARQIESLMEKSLSFHGPIYFRISVEPVPAIYDDSSTFEIGKANTVCEGKDGSFICSGVVVKYALEASKRIYEKYGKQIQVIDMHTIKPIDREAVLQAAKTERIVAAQDHNIMGGLGTYIAQVLAEEGLGINFINLGIPDQFVAMAHAPYLYHKFGYDTEGLEKAMLQLLNK